jgi:phage gp29-like protein
MSRFSDLQVRLGQDGTLWYNAAGDLQSRWVDTPNPLLEQTREYFGRALTPETIERVICMADMGYMRTLTDLVAEATRIDPHWAMCDRKRLRAVYSAKVNVVPASGNGIDPKLAKTCADMVRQQWAWIPNPKQVLARLNWSQKNGRGASEKIWRENQHATPGSESVKWRIDRVNWIHARRLQFGPERELRVRDDLWGGLGFEARGLDLRQYPYKFISYLPQQYDEYPEREGYGPRALYSSFFWRFSTREQLVLLEVFGRPWRLVEEIDPAGKPVQGDQLKAAAEDADKMSANATGYSAPGTRIRIEQPVQGAGQVHKDVKTDSNDAISKLILGEVRTSDAKPGALGSTAEEVAKDVSDEVKSEDAVGLSDLLTEQFAADVITLNLDAGALDHCPRMEVTYEAPVDRTVEIERTTKVFDMGIPLIEKEVYERTGYTMPGPEDTTIQKAPPPPAFPGGAPGAPPALPAPEGAGGDGSPLGDGGSGTKGEEDQASMTAPSLFPNFQAIARADHVLELVGRLGANAGAGTRVLRTVPKPKKTEE